MESTILLPVDTFVITSSRRDSYTAFPRDFDVSVRAFTTGTPLQIRFHRFEEREASI